MKTYKTFCNCSHDFQDKEHGKGVRVCTPTKKTTQDKVKVRCTVCAREHEVSK